MKSTRDSRKSGKETNAILTLKDKGNILPTYEDGYCGLTFCNTHALLAMSRSLLYEAQLVGTTIAKRAHTAAYCKSCWQLARFE